LTNERRRCLLPRRPGAAARALRCLVGSSVHMRWICTAILIVAGLGAGMLFGQPPPPQTPNELRQAQVAAATEAAVNNLLQDVQAQYITHHVTVKDVLDRTGAVNQ